MGSYGRLVDGKEVVSKFHSKNSRWSRHIILHKLKPCPKCGATQEDNNSVRAAYYGFCEGKDGWIIACKKCRNQTKYYRTEIEAVNEWNGGD